LSQKGWSGLETYLAGPVLDQITTEFGSTPEHVSFVFGHTHKPFDARRPISGFGADVDIFNTGGWVVDATTPSSAHGGSAVLISSRLEVASLRFFNQTLDGRPSPPVIGGSGPWADDLRSQIRFDEQPWAAMAERAATAVKERNQLAAAYQRQY
jgi:hypothetical protein